MIKTKKMKTKIGPQDELFQEAMAVGFRVGALAKKYGVSSETMRKFFHENYGASARKVLKSWRMRKAFDLLERGCRIKVLAPDLGYANLQDFSHDFRRCFGFPPSALPQYTSEQSLQE